jgi:hypothetical protein
MKNIKSILLIYILPDSIMSRKIKHEAKAAARRDASR